MVLEVLEASVVHNDCFVTTVCTFCSRYLAFQSVHFRIKVLIFFWNVMTILNINRCRLFSSYSTWVGSLTYRHSRVATVVATRTKCRGLSPLTRSSSLPSLSSCWTLTFTTLTSNPNERWNLPTLYAIFEVYTISVSVLLFLWQHFSDYRY